VNKEEYVEPVEFYDAHCHVLTLSHPDFLSFLDTVRNRRLESFYAQATSPNYLVGALFFKGGERIRNMLSVMENDVASIFALMEDDLAGKYAKPGDPPPLLAGSELVLGRLRFDRLVIAPLIMDFEMKSFSPSDTYYDRPPAKPVEAQVKDVLYGLREYRRSRPNGFLEVRPFLGINTRNYRIDELEALLESAFASYRRGAAAAHEAFMSMKDFDVESSEPLPLCFAGVKLYPPLGFDPWPDSPAEREKVDLLYSFCEARDIPVTSHCDDQGFRVISLEDAWSFTSPARWRKALEAHPGLRLDLAHFGAQYSRPVGRSKSLSLRESLNQSTEWTEEIIRLMGDFPRVYTDISFNGSEASYYDHFLVLLEGLPSAMRDLVITRVLFGSDFMVNLSKIRSYSDYYRLFADSALPDEWKRLLGHDNPRAFLTGE
jgi:predicted TIM-barrel fold metal-dependent hydrolase